MMSRGWLAWFLAVLMLFAGHARAADAIKPGQRFVAVAFHDVVDDPAQLDSDAVTTARLVEFFDYLRGTGWKPVTLDEVDAARRGERPLPDKAILVTFDDGYSSLYTRVFPLVLAYRVPIVAALQGSWLAPPPGSQVAHGSASVPREKFITSEQAREMARSGLVEFASHSYDLQHGVPGNPQGNEMPAAVTRLYAKNAYESETAYRTRLADDLRKSREFVADFTGRPPRAMVWPFGRYSAVATEVAQSVGFSFALTLDPEPANAALPMRLPRYLPTGNPVLAEIDANLRFRPRLPSAQRVVCVDPGQVWTGDATGTNERLGRLIERLRRLGSTAVVIDVVARDASGSIAAAWFPNSELPVRADVLSRLVWQLQTRAGVEAWLRVPSTTALAAMGDTARVRRLFGELGAQVPASGVVIEGAPGLAGQRAEPGEGGAMPWQVRQLRALPNAATLAAPDALALQVFGEVERWRTPLKLVLLAEAGASVEPSALADFTLFPVTVDSAPRFTERFAADRPSGINPGRRIGLWLTGSAAPTAKELVATTRRFQLAGGTAFGWCPDDAPGDMPPADQVAPDVSASTFPVRF